MSSYILYLLLVQIEEALNLLKKKASFLYTLLENENYRNVLRDETVLQNYDDNFAVDNEI